MPPRAAVCLTTFLALFAYASAQSTAQSFNLTLTFSPSTNDTSSRDAPCADRNDPKSVTFSTYFIPYEGDYVCVNLAKAFEGNGTFGGTPNTDPYGGSGYVNISYATYNRRAYDSRANYSQVLYKQVDSGEQSDEADERFYAARNVYFYPAEDCLQAKVDPSTGDVYPWYMSSCRSAGDCERFPYAVRSFEIQGPDSGQRRKKNECALGGAYGAGSAIRPQWVLAFVMAAAGIVLQAM